MADMCLLIRTGSIRGQGLPFVLSDDGVHVRLGVGLIYSRHGCHAGSTGSAAQVTRDGLWQCRQPVVDAVTLPRHVANRRELIITTTMPILLGKLHDALRAANVPEGLAREAAEEAANGYSKLEEGLNALKLELEQGFAAVRLEIANVRPEMEKGFAAVRQEIADLRVDAAVSRAETKGELRRLEWLLAGLLTIALAIGTRYFLHGLGRRGWPRQYMSAW
jgi:hypothetical protein